MCEEAFSLAGSIPISEGGGEGSGSGKLLSSFLGCPLTKKVSNGRAGEGGREKGGGDGSPLFLAPGDDK